jgi:alpha-mannosidase
MNDSEQSFVSSLLIKIERLRSLSQIDILTDWRIDRGCGSIDTDTSKWDRVNLNEKGKIAWESGKQEIWLAQKIIIPTDLQGYPVTNLVCRLAFTWWAELAQVFVDGVLVQEGDLFDHSPRVVLMSAAVPGTVLDVRLRLVSPGHDIGALMRSRVVYESLDAMNPEPGWWADELAVMVKQMASFNPARLGELGGIVEGIDYDLLGVDVEGFIGSVFDVKLRGMLMLGGGEDLPTPPFGYPSQEGIFPDYSLEGGIFPAPSPLQGEGWGGVKTIQLLGHAHLDMAWLWEVAETWEVAERTFRSTLSLQQLFPDLTFCHSTPALYEWMELNQPEVFAGICAQIQAGKWEVVGGMWIEPDLNLISGESIARQLIYGQGYNLSRFGAVTKVAWLPDTFGFCQQLPQLLQQGGIDYFVTQKFLWNDTTQFPHQLFWWEALDGSRVLSLMSSPIGEGIDPLKMVDYACKWQTDTGINESLYLFGVGDHGGGPTRDMLEIADRWSNSDVFPQLEFTTAVKYLDKLAGSSDSHLLPVWKDELYLEFHRGCFTTHADQKRSNRQCEDLLYQAELWSSIACIVTKQDYPDDLKLQIETAWKQTLFNQFHDIIPGTAIAPVYVTANEGWENVERITTQIISDALRMISDRIILPTPPIEGAIAIVIFNALNWKRSEVIKYPLDAKETRLFQKVGFLDAWCVFDADGKLLPSQTTAEHILFIAEDLPSVGYRLFWLVLDMQSGIDGGEDLPTPPCGYPSVGVASPQGEEGTFPTHSLVLSHFQGKTRVKNPLPGGVPEGGGGYHSASPQTTETPASSRFIFKNQFVEVKINPETGDIASIYDSLNHREIISTAANQLQAFQDKGQYWDAWNIDPKYAQKPLPPSQLKSIEWVENGIIRQRLRVVRELAGAEFRQDYILDAHSSIVRIETAVDWQTEHVLIKANFPLNLTANISTAETACGAIDRTTQPETAAETAKWELPMHRWVDLTDSRGEYGVSLLNDCKYGFDAGTDYLRLTLLRGSKWPNPTADKGYHEFTYAVYPHSDTWKAAQTVRKGLELNSPLQVLQLAPRTKIDGDRDLASIDSFIDLQSENLVLMAFKPSESLDDKSWILRCYECHGVESEIKLAGDLDLRIDRVVNLLEQPQSEKVNSTIKRWQIKSFGI